MSLFNTMNTATTGLGSSSSSLAVIGDNIANLNTTGYKGNRTEFSDNLHNTVYAKGGPTQLGTGTGLTRISTLFGQGSISASENALDMAISGAAQPETIEATRRPRRPRRERRCGPRPPWNAESCHLDACHLKMLPPRLYPCHKRRLYQL